MRDFILNKIRERLGMKAKLRSSRVGKGSMKKSGKKKEAVSKVKPKSKPKSEKKVTSKKPSAKQARRAASVKAIEKRAVAPAVRKPPVKLAVPPPPPPQHLRPFQEMLLKMREGLMTGIMGEVRSESEAFKEEIGDVYDMATSDRDKELVHILGDRERQKLAQIDEALQRIQNREYGICEECEEEIGVGRLKAMPFTRVCVDCQSSLEQEEKEKRILEEGEDQTLANVTYPTEGEEE